MNRLTILLFMIADLKEATALGYTMDFHPFGTPLTMGYPLATQAACRVCVSP